MLPVSLDVALLKLQLPELVLRPGMSVVARVASRGEGAVASLVLAGALIKANVPDAVQAGQTLKLLVLDTSPERVTLGLEATQPAPGQPAQAAAPGPPATPPPAVDPNAGALAAQAQAQLRDADPDGGGGPRREGAAERPSVALAYETPALGRLDFRVERGPEGVTVAVGAGAKAFFLAGARADELKQAVEGKLGLPAVVRVNPRRDPLDLRA